jgi:hypothetical protein
MPGDATFSRGAKATLGSAALLFVFMSLHFADDIVRGEPGRLGASAEVFGLAAAAFLVVLLFGGGLFATERRSGAVLLVLAGLFAFLGALTHVVGATDNLAAVAAAGGVFGVWSLLMAVVFGFVTTVLALGGLRTAGQAA